MQAKTSLLLLKILTMGPFFTVIWQRFFLSRRLGLVFRKTEISVFFFFPFVKFWYFANLFDEYIGTFKNSFSHGNGKTSVLCHTWKWEGRKIFCFEKHKVKK